MRLENINDIVQENACFVFKEDESLLVQRKDESTTPDHLSPHLTHSS